MSSIWVIFDRKSVLLAKSLCYFLAQLKKYEKVYFFETRFWIAEYIIF